MRVMVLVKATPETEAGVLPSEADFAAMGRFNTELVQAGVLLDADGLGPSARGARVRFRGEAREVVAGPFPDPTSLVAGFWLWQVRSLDEAIAWVQRCPNPTGAIGEIEIRPLYEPEDFGPGFTETLREEEACLRTLLKDRAK